MVEECFLDFALLCGCSTIYSTSSDGITISSVIDALVEKFFIIVFVLKLIKFGLLTNVKGVVNFHFP